MGQQEDEEQSARNALHQSRLQSARIVPFASLLLRRHRFGNGTLLLFGWACVERRGHRATRMAEGRLHQKVRGASVECIA